MNPSPKLQNLSKTQLNFNKDISSAHFSNTNLDLKESIVFNPGKTDKLVMHTSNDRMSLKIVKKQRTNDEKEKNKKDRS